MNLYVGNLSYDLSEGDLKNTFQKYGEVESARLVMDRDTGRPRGFGFVEMKEKQAGLDAIDALNEKEIDGRRMVVNEARPKNNRR